MIWKRLRDSNQERRSRLAAERLDTFFRMLGTDRHKLETLLFDASEGAKIAQAVGAVLLFRRQVLKDKSESLARAASGFPPEQIASLRALLAELEEGAVVADEEKHYRLVESIEGAFGAAGGDPSRVTLVDLNGGWSQYHSARRALLTLPLVGTGIEVADTIFRLAEGDKRDKELFGVLMDRAGEVQDAEPNSGVMPTLREAYILRLFRAAQIADTDEDAPSAIEDAIGRLPWNRDVELFGKESLISDARLRSRLFERVEDVAATRVGYAFLSDDLVPIGGGLPWRVGETRKFVSGYYTSPTPADALAHAWTFTLAKFDVSEPVEPDDADERHDKEFRRHNLSRCLTLKRVVDAKRVVPEWACECAEEALVIAEAHYLGSENDFHKFQRDDLERARQIIDDRGCPAGLPPAAAQARRRARDDVIAKAVAVRVAQPSLSIDVRDHYDVIAKVVATAAGRRYSDPSVDLNVELNATHAVEGAWLATYYAMEKSEEDKHYTGIRDALRATDYAAHTLAAAAFAFADRDATYLDVYFATRREYHDRLNRRLTLLFLRSVQPSRSLPGSTENF